MKYPWTNFSFAYMGIAITLCTQAIACTDFRVTAKDGTVVIARSMEFAEDLKSNLRSSPRGRNFTTTSSDGNPGITWTAKYGYLYLDGMNVDSTIDGMNEKGLSFEALYLPGLAQYQTVEPNQTSQALPYLSMGDWALSNFETVEEVRNALANVVVFGQKIPGLGDMIFPLHFSFFDETGKGIIVEYIGGKIHIHDNKIGVLTNAPSYDWHITNLANYINLKPVNPNPVLVKGITFVSTGQGSGMIGLPGDISPPSRFVKTTILSEVVLPAQNAKEAVNLAEHILNNVDIPLGLARESTDHNYTSELTQWAIFKDLTHKMFYYRTYHDLSLRSVDMSKIDFSTNGPKLKMPIESPGYVKDVTEDFIKSTASTIKK